MAFEIKPWFPFEAVTNSQIVRTYRIRGLDADYNGVIADSFAAAAAQQVYNTAPGSVAGFNKRTVGNVRHLTDHKDDRIFTVEIVYGELQRFSAEPPPVNDVQFSWGITARTVHVNYALSHVGYFMKAGETAPSDPILAIDVDAEGNPRGADIFSQSIGFTLAWTLENATVDAPKRKQWEDLVLTVNDSTYGHRAAGEVLFLGLTGSTDFGNGRERHQFEFAVQKNIPAPGETISGIPNVIKNGWERIDPIRKYTEDAAQNKVIEEIIGFNRLTDYPTATWTGVLPPL